MTAGCNHESLDICEEIIEEGPIALVDGEPTYRRYTQLYYCCSFCGQRMPGEVPAFDPIQEE